MDCDKERGVFVLSHAHTNSFLSIFINNSSCSLVGGVRGQELYGGSIPGKKLVEPGALPPCCGLATQPGGLGGPVWESGGLASAPEGHLSLPAPTPSLQLTQDT